MTTWIKIGVPFIFFKPRRRLNYYCKSEKEKSMSCLLKPKNKDTGVTEEPSHTLLDSYVLTISSNFSAM